VSAVNSAAPRQAVVEAALVVLEQMGLSPADLTAVPPPRKPVPTFAEYVPVVSAAVSADTRRAYGSYWNRITQQWGDRRLDEPTPSEIRQLMTYVKTHVVARRNARGGRSAQEHLLRYADGRPITYRRYDHLWTRLGRHLPWVATQQISMHWIRHTTLTWVERLRLRRRSRLRRPHRRRQRNRRHLHLRPRQPLRSRRRPSHAGWRTSPARHDGRAVIGMAAVTADASPAMDPVLRGPVPARTSGPAAADGSPAAVRPTRTVRSWPLLVLAAPAAAEVWSGWVGIAQKTGFGLVTPLPGIWPSLHLDTAITLPVGVEAYAAYALRAWLASEHAVSARTRQFAKWSAIFSFALGMAGQIAYHLLAQANAIRAPWPITTIVSCLPVLVLAMGTTLAHMLRADATLAHTPGGRAAGPAAPRSPDWSSTDRHAGQPDQDQATETTARASHPSGPREPLLERSSVAAQQRWARGP
jgi:hypothetical protein